MDTIKGQKIIAAIYLVTGHLSDNDSFKTVLRQKSMLLVERDEAARADARAAIETLLGAAVLAQCIGEKNASIIMLELGHFMARPCLEQADAIAALFAPHLMPAAHAVKDSRPATSFSKPPSTVLSHRTNVADMLDTKNKRQDKILSFINDRKSAGIKDIAELFPEVSEKTIQRELGTLVTTGKVVKRGEKRWSVYLAVV